MGTGIAFSKMALAALAAGLLLCGCGRHNPVSSQSAQSDDTPWVRRDDQGRIRSIGKPAPEPDKDAPSALTEGKKP